jgi:hypothetical protein
MNNPPTNQYLRTVVLIYDLKGSPETRPEQTGEKARWWS